MVVESYYKMPLKNNLFQSRCPKRISWLLRDESSTFDREVVNDMDVDDLLVKLINSSAEKKHIFCMYKEGAGQEGLSYDSILVLLV